MENILSDIDAEDSGRLRLVAQHFSGPFSVENSPRSMRGFGGADHRISYEAWPEAQAVDEVRSEWQVSIRRACDALEFDRSIHHYKSRRSGQADLEQKIKEICNIRIRYGYRRVHVLLRREGWRHGQNKTRRIYRELGLQLRNRTPKRRVKAKLRDDRRPATRSNETWAMDFVHDPGDRTQVLLLGGFHACSFLSSLRGDVVIIGRSTLGMAGG